MSKSARWLFACTFVLAFMGSGRNADAGAEVNIGINIAPPPALVIPAPPPVMVIPETYIYFAPTVEVDILFYQDYWYRFHGGHWYRATVYNGKWIYVHPPRVPAALLRLPPNYRHVPPGHRRIPYADLKKHWRTWEKEKHWDKPDRREKRAHTKVKREHGERKGGGKGKH
ncbi:MAG: hypothetical protein A2170_00145 [Deltaproteobacteria bacterium RBG_13_53_10]|nr:MAG: hypothetical protein A2170_00145 [Deltaproteobacteria bacterium RBG_13_53_10]